MAQDSTARLRCHRRILPAPMAGFMWCHGWQRQQPTSSHRPWRISSSASSPGEMATGSRPQISESNRNLWPVMFGGWGDISFEKNELNYCTYTYRFSAPVFADMFILGVKAEFNIIIYIFFLGGSVPCHLERGTFCHLLSYKLITLRIGVYLKSDLSE